MASWEWIIAATGVAVGAYAIFVALLFVAGRGPDARAAARFVPDCVVLFRRLLADDRVPRRAKVVVAVLIAYLAMPFDLVPDFIPVAGQLDDAIAVALVLRMIMRAGGPDVVREHWPGPSASLDALVRASGSGRMFDRPPSANGRCSGEFQKPGAPGEGRHEHLRPADR